MNRRGVLAMLSRAPVVGAIAGKQIADSAAAQVMGSSVSGLRYGDSCTPQPTSTTSLDSQHYRLAFKIPSVRREVESLLYEENFNISAIDHDIAVMRSFSLSAKIAYQRQRNVERRIETMQRDWPWQRMSKIIAKVCGL